MKQTIATVHFNTPELTEAMILSVRKVGIDWPVVVFDNSNQRPFDKKMPGVKVINNRKGRYFNFEKELAKFPHKNPYYLKVSNYGSAKHMMSVQKLFDLIPEGFILVESDILLRKDIRFLWQEEYAAVGKVQNMAGYKVNIHRLLPMLCYLNVPLLKKHGAKYYDPTRTFGLLPNPDARCNWYDTGAPILEDIRKTKPELVALLYKHLTDWYVHFRHGSWDNKRNINDYHLFLKQYERLWNPQIFVK